MSIDTLIAVLTDRLANLREHAQERLDADDWTGVSDTAMRVRETIAQIGILTHHKERS